jgi:hypothetical protein
MTEVEGLRGMSSELEIVTSLQPTRVPGVDEVLGDDGVHVGSPLRERRGALTRLPRPERDAVLDPVKVSSQ